MPAERRLITLLFADLSGYTSLGAALDPEDLHALVAPLVAAMRRLAEDYGALVPGVQGDGFMAVFGAPLAHEDDPRRAVLAAAELQRLVGRWQTSRAGEPVPDVHIGIHAGEAFVAPGRDGVTVTGDPVNVASRLCDQAAGGEVIVSEDVVALVDLPGAWSDVAEVRLRNRPEPVRVRRLRWSDLAAASAARSTRGAVALVDRDEVMAALDRLLIPGQSGRLAVLVGEAGVGKSRVANEWLDRRTEHLVLRGHAPAFAAPSWTAPLAEVLWRLARERTGDAQLKPRAALGEVLRLSGPMSAGVARRLGRLLGVEPNSAEIDTDDDQATAFVAWVRSVAVRHRVIVLLEDLYWASLPLLDRLPELTVAAGPGSVILAAARPETPGLDGMLRIDVPPLDEPDQHVLVERLLPGCPASVASVLVERSGGNPFFAEEVAQLLIDDDTLRVGPDGVTVIDSSRLNAVPTTMRLFVTARLDLLSPVARRVMAASAVAGDALEPTVLDALCPDLDVSLALDELVTRGLLRHRPARTAAEARRGGRLAFRHALVRDVTYEGLSRAERRDLHLRAARWYAALPGGHLDAKVARGNHAERALGATSQPDAELVTEVVESLLAWAQAVVAEQPRTCAEVAGRGLVLAETLDDPELTAELALLVARSTLATGDEAASIAAAERAVRMSTDERLRARAHLAAGRAFTYAWRNESARASFAAAVEGFSALGESEGVARARAEAARLPNSGGLATLIEALEDAYELAAAASDRDLRVQLALELAYLSSVRGGEALERWMLRATAELTDDDIVGHSWTRLAEAYRCTYTCNPRGALLHATEAADGGGSLGLVQIEMPAMMIAALAAARCGRFDDAALWLQAFEVKAESRPLRTRLLARTSGAQLLVRRGDLDEGLARLEVPEVDPEELQEEDPFFFAVLAGEVALDRGHFGAARALFDRAARGFAHAGEPLAALQPMVLAAAARVLSRSGLGGEDGALPALAEELGGHVAAALARGWLVQDALLSGAAPVVRPDDPQLDVVELRALDRENAALAAGGDAALFAQAAHEWESLGLTAFHARALTWAGDEQRAAEILDRLQSPPGLVGQWRDQLAAVRR